MRIIPYLLTVLFFATSAGAEDLSKNPDGVPWLDTNDDWGRPWGDAANHFYRNLEAAGAAPGAAAGEMEFAVGTELSLRKVFRPKVWFKGSFGSPVALEAARGEYEAFQLVVCPIADAERELTYLSPERAQGEGSLIPKTVSIDAIEVSPLRHAGSDFRIETSAMRIYRVGYIRTLPGQYPVMHVGQWPDPLLPMRPFEVSNPNCQPIWIEVRVPHDAPAGDYGGHVTVRGPHDVRVDIRLTVWDFALPDPPRTVSNGWSLHQWFTRDGTDRLVDRLNVLLDHRLVAWHTAFDQRNDLRDLSFCRIFFVGELLHRVLGEHEILAAFQYFDLDLSRLRHQFGRIRFCRLLDLGIDDHEEQDHGAEAAAHAVQEGHAEDFKRATFTCHAPAPSQ